MDLASGQKPLSTAQYGKNSTSVYFVESGSVGGAICVKSLAVMTDETEKEFRSYKVKGRGHNGRRQVKR